MDWSRRAFAASAACATLTLAGCAGGQSDDAATTAAPNPVMDRPAAKWGSANPLGWWASRPNLAVVNDGADGVTTYVAIYGPNWIETQFRETVSLRGAVAGEPAARVSFEPVGVVGASGVLAVETADELSNAHDWNGGGDRRGIVVRLQDDRIRFPGGQA